jgi:glutathione S-transferase
MIQLYSADVCPFAQRVRAVLRHLDLRFELHEVDLDARDPDFLKLTPTGAVPLLLDGRLKLYESAVICEYLADAYGWTAAFAGEPGLRARQRLAMAAWDATIAPAFYDGLRDGGLDKDARTEVQAELRELAQTVQTAGRQPGDLLSFHVAPHWARMAWLRDLSPVADLIGEWIDLRAWLDACVAQAPIQATLPDRGATIARYRAKFARG